MKLYVKNKIISLGDGSKVYDENGENAYFVKGAIVTLRKRKYINDLEHNTIYKVKNKLLHLMRYTAFICDPKGKKLITIKEKNKVLNRGYIITSEDAEYEVEWGGWFTGANKIYRNGEEWANIKRKLGFTDVFEVEFERPEDAPLVVAFTIAFDNINDRYDE